MSRRLRIICIALLDILVGAGTSKLFAQSAQRGPFPVHAAGWGPPAGGGLWVSRWAEDWTAARASGVAPLGKVMPVGVGDLTVSAETRARFDRKGADGPTETLWRGVLGADLRLGEHLRVFAEFASGETFDDSSSAPANFANDAALNQAFVDVHGDAGGTSLGAMIGRQEFSDGPRQLLSVGDGPNLHRTWNGVRSYMHAEHVRAGAFYFCATKLGRAGFDEQIDCDECLRGANGSFAITRGERGSGVFLDPFWLNSEIPSVRLQGETHDDRRDTLGIRLWGRTGRLGFDWTMAHQIGHHGSREVDAWGSFSSQDWLLADSPWHPRATVHFDLASGGDEHGVMRTFHPLYSSSSYLGEGRLLSLSNLILLAPGLSVTPTSSTRVSVEYGMAWRFDPEDSVYGFGLRAYPGSDDVAGNEIGGLLRVEARWEGPANLSVACGYERLFAGTVFDRAGLPDGEHAFLSVTLRL